MTLHEVGLPICQGVWVQSGGSVRDRGLIGEEDIALRQESIQGLMSGVGTDIEGYAFLIGVEGTKTRAVLAVRAGPNMAQAVTL